MAAPGIQNSTLPGRFGGITILGRGVSHMRCDAGRGCIIDCPGGCVARWDQDLNLCETACWDPLPISNRSHSDTGSRSLCMEATALR